VNEIPEIVDPRTGELMDTDSVPGLATVAALHDEQIYQLSAAVAQIQEADDSPVGAGVSGPYVWHTLSATDGAKLWEALADWVGWLRGRYPLARQIPLCWWRHPELVEELTALWLAWREAYTEKGASLTAAADWHGRWLPEFLRRVGAGGWNIACEGEHKERIKTLYDGRRVDDEEAFVDFVGHDHAERLGSDLGAVAATGEHDEQKERQDMDDTTLQAALASGEARTLGDLPGSPVAYADAYWVPEDDGAWVAIEDAETVSYLADAERRMRLADEAVAWAEES
jgi:hypothetical protein